MSMSKKELRAASNRNSLQVIQLEKDWKALREWAKRGDKANEESYKVARLKRDAVALSKLLNSLASSKTGVALDCRGCGYGVSYPTKLQRLDNTYWKSSEYTAASMFAKYDGVIKEFKHSKSLDTPQKDKVAFQEKRAKHYAKTGEVLAIPKPKVYESRNSKVDILTLNAVLAKTGYKVVKSK